MTCSVTGGPTVCVFSMALGTYACALILQVLGRYTKVIPRLVWCLFVTLIEHCSVAGRNYLFNIFEYFLPITSYWVSPWLAIALEEHVLFHVLRRVPFDWTAWEGKKRLLVGAAALSDRLIGWAGAITGMSQIWLQGMRKSSLGSDLTSTKVWDDYPPP